jgi:hypothetical protein
MGAASEGLIWTWKDEAALFCPWGASGVRGRHAPALSKHVTTDGLDKTDG